MGGLRKKLPWTFATFLVGSLSLAGVWPFSGFFSKEEILGSALEDNAVFFAVLLATAFMTAFYIFRAIFLTFAGRQRGESHPHESPASMLVPMVILAALALGSGFLNANGWFGAFLGHGETRGFLEGAAGILTHPLAWGSLAAAGAGILLAYLFYGAKRFSPGAARERFEAVYEMLRNKYWMDELYEKAIARNLLYRGLFRAFAWFDRAVIDGAVNGLAWLGLGGGRAAQRAQTGQLQLYGIAALLGAAVIVIILVLVR
jgi:NADH-quinone oxidoreductase subunit L